MADQEKLQKFKELFKGKAQRLFLAGMAVLLVLRLLLFLGESGYAAGAVPDPQAITKLDATFSQDAQTYKDVQKMVQPMVEFSKSEYWVLAQYDMFDPQHVRDAERLRAQADSDLLAAQAAFKRGELKQAEALAGQILLRYPGHAATHKLKSAITEKLTKKDDGQTSAPQPAGTAPAPAQP